MKRRFKLTIVAFAALFFSGNAIAAKEALATKEGLAAEAVFDGIMNCESNRLWKFMPTK